MSGGITHVDLSIYNSVASNLFNLSQDSTRVVNHLNAASSCLSGELASCVDLSGYVSACNQIGESYSKVGSAIKQSIEEYIKADEEARSEIQGAEETGIEEKPKNFLSTLCVGVTSILSGVVDIVDSVVDAGAMIVGEATSAVVGLFDQDAATNIKQGVADYVSVDWGSSASKWFYEDTALGKEINATSHITYDSGVANGLRMAGTIAGNIALNFLPGGAIVTGVASAAQAMGRTGEKALNEGATLDQAFGVGVTNAGVGFVTGYFGGQFASQARSALSFTQLGGIALKNAAVQMIEPVADVTSQYLFYKKGQGKSWADVAQEENLGAQLAITGVMAAGSTFLAGYKNVKNAKAEQKLAAAGGSAVAAKETGDAIDSLGQSEELRIRKVGETDGSGMSGDSGKLPTGEQGDGITSVGRTSDDLATMKLKQELYAKYGPDFDADEYIDSMTYELLNNEGMVHNDVNRIMEYNDPIKIMKLSERPTRNLIMGSMNDESYNKLGNAVLAKCGAEYEQGRIFAANDTSGEFNTYRTHGSGHALEVSRKTVEANQAVARALGNKAMDGFSADIDSYEAFVAGVYHDVGMSGTTMSYVDPRTGQQVRNVYYDKNTGTAGIIEGNFDGKEASIVRKNHSLNSAMYVLDPQNAQQFDDLGVDPNRIALLTFAHTKSGSGVNILNSGEMWDSAVDRLTTAGKVRFGDDFDMSQRLVQSGLKTADGKWTSDLGEMASETLSLRLGDANTNNVNLGINQGGKTIEFDPQEVKQSIAQNGGSLYDADGKLIPAATSGDFDRFELVKQELGGSEGTISIGGQKGTIPKEAGPVSSAYIFGESNLDFGTEVIDGKLTEVITVKDPSFARTATVFNVEERVGELATAANGGFKSRVVIDLQGKGDSTLIDILEQFATRTKTQDLEIVIKP